MGTSNKHQDILIHLPLDCLLSCLFGITSKETSISGPLWGESIIDWCGMCFHIMPSSCMAHRGVSTCTQEGSKQLISLEWHSARLLGKTAVSPLLMHQWLHYVTDIVYRYNALDMWNSRVLAGRILEQDILTSNVPKTSKININIYRNCPEVWKCSRLSEFYSDYVLKFA